MIDNEPIVFDSVAAPVREQFGAYVIGCELSNRPPKFPALSIVKCGGSANKKYSTFNKIENAAAEEYKLEAFSNLDVGREKQAKEIIAVADEVMGDLGYARTFYKFIPNAADLNVARLCVRYKSNIVI